MYVDGFVIPVPRKKLKAYLALARKAAKVWIDHGALEVRECVADDVKVGKVTSFPRSVKLARGETVIFAWIAFRSRKERDRVNAAVMKDPRLASMADPETDLPFDMMRMIFGGFEVAVKAQA